MKRALFWWIIVEKGTNAKTIVSWQRSNQVHSYISKRIGVDKISMSLIIATVQKVICVSFSPHTLFTSTVLPCRVRLCVSLTCWEQTPYVTNRLMIRAYLELQCQLEVEFAINTTGEKILIVYLPQLENVFLEWAWLVGVQATPLLRWLKIKLSLF